MRTGSPRVGGEERRVERDVADVAAGDVEPGELADVERRRSASAPGTMRRQIARAGAVSGNGN